MTDYSEQGAVPIEYAAVADPPTVNEVLEQQRREHPDGAISRVGAAATDEEAATEEAGGEIVDRKTNGGPEIEGPNSA